MIDAEGMSTSPVAHFRAANLVTYVAIAAALAACLAPFVAAPAAPSWAGAALAVAALADIYDGRFARMFPRTDEQKAFGVQIDSLSDVLSFGVAPVLVLARVSRVEGAPWWGAFFVCGLGYLLCAVTRLAHYNVITEATDGFIGVPTTVFGVVWSAWLFAPTSAAVACVGLVVGGAAMIAPIRIRRPGPALFAALTLLALGLAIAHASRLFAAPGGALP